MYKISVPLMNANVTPENREQVLRQVRRFDAERIFLALGTYETDAERRRATLESLRDNCRFFRERGFEVGAWIWTFMLKDNETFRAMRSINGTELREFMCPTDGAFTDFALDYVKDIARCGVDIIQFDDDFRYGFLGDAPACLCDGHIARINGLTGERSTRKELRQRIVCGSKNKYRDAFLQVNGDVFRDFAGAVRAAVNEVDPSIRISLCACLSSWDLDGTDARELSEILAGKTKPLLRLIGAPYWAVAKNWGNSLQDVVELERMESAWSRAERIEIMAEGDAYPRPRSACPASYLEGFDTAIRASGCTDGILKYGMDYVSAPDYETGYAAMHEKNRALYAEIDRVFGGKVSLGVRVYESMKKIGDAVTPTRVNESIDIEHLFFSKAARTLAYNTVPTVYEGRGVCGIVFDENARALPTSALSGGLILDIAAAEILTERGVDVGLCSIDGAYQGELERFLHNDNRVMMGRATVCGVKLKERAEVLSTTDTAIGPLPVSYRYENADGNRFLVLNVNTRSEHDGPLKCYERGRQYAEQIPWLSGNRLPAYVYGSPALYLQCKAADGCMAVGLWNFFADPVLSPTVQLSETYRSVSFIGCSGSLAGDRVVLSDIPPFGFAALEVKK